MIIGFSFTPRYHLRSSLWVSQKFCIILCLPVRELGKLEVGCSIGYQFQIGLFVVLFVSAYTIILIKQGHNKWHILEHLQRYAGPCCCGNISLLFGGTNRIYRVYPLSSHVPHCWSRGKDFRVLRRGETSSLLLSFCTANRYGISFACCCCQHWRSITFFGERTPDVVPILIAIQK